jgi:hypothetical protein
MTNLTEKCLCVLCSPISLHGTLFYSTPQIGTVTLSNADGMKRTRTYQIREADFVLTYVR